MSKQVALVVCATLLTRPHSHQNKMSAKCNLPERWNKATTERFLSKHQTNLNSFVFELGIRFLHAVIGIVDGNWSRCVYECHAELDADVGPTH